MVRAHTSFECSNKRVYIRTLYVYQHFLFDFPFDEIYVRFLFFTLGRPFFCGSMLGVSHVRNCSGPVSDLPSSRISSLCWNG